LPRHAAAETGEQDFQSHPPFPPALFYGKIGSAGMAASVAMRGLALALPAFSREQKSFEQEYITLTKTLNERITETKEKITQYENQVKRLTQRQTEAARKAEPAA